MALDFRVSRSSYKIGPTASSSRGRSESVQVEGPNRFYERYTQKPLLGQSLSTSAVGSPVSVSTAIDPSSAVMRKAAHQVITLVEVSLDPSGKQFLPGLLLLDKPKGTLCYYKIVQDTLRGPRRELIGTFNLDMVAMVEKDTRPKAHLAFVIHYRGKKHYFRAASWKELEDWIDILNECARINVSMAATGTGDAVGNHHRGDLSMDPLGGGVAAEESANSSSEDDSSQNSLPLGKPERVIKAGYCVKQGRIVKNWKRRYLVLDSEYVAYYKDEKSKASLKKIPLQSIDDAKVCADEQCRDNLMVLYTHNRNFYIQFDSPAEMTSWIEEIRKILNLPPRTYL